MDCSLDALGVAEINVTGGSGDITAVSTASDSGLAGGADAGDVALSLDVKNLPIYDTPISHLDHLPITDESVAGDPTRRLTLTQYATWAAGQPNGGIGAVDGKIPHSDKRASTLDHSRECRPPGRMGSKCLRPSRV